MKARSKIIFSLTLVLVAGFLLATLGQTKIKTVNAATCRADIFWIWADGKEYTIPPGEALVGDQIAEVAKFYDCQGQNIVWSNFLDGNQIRTKTVTPRDPYTPGSEIITLNTNGKYSFKITLPDGSVLASSEVQARSKTCNLSINFDVNPKAPTSADQELTLKALITQSSGVCVRFKGTVDFTASIDGGSPVAVGTGLYDMYFGASNREATLKYTLRGTGFDPSKNSKVTFYAEARGDGFYLDPFSPLGGGNFLSVSAKSSGVNVCLASSSGGCSAPTPSGGGTGNQGVQDTNYNFELTPPIAIPSFVELINAIGRWIFNLSIPLAVIVIIYAGIKLLMSRGEPAEVTKAKNILKYAIWGLVVIFIGKGFISLVKSILQLGSQ